MAEDRGKRYYHNRYPIINVDDNTEGEKQSEVLKIVRKWSSIVFPHHSSVEQLITRTKRL